jgi:hypothetical protein
MKIVQHDINKYHVQSSSSSISIYKYILVFLRQERSYFSNINRDLRNNHARNNHALWPGGHLLLL